jgi:DNA-binding GntR family transcriptional regulator
VIWCQPLHECGVAANAWEGLVSEIEGQIDRFSVAEQVYEHLRNAIVSGQIAQGERVVELQIARSLRTSRAPVREAVNRLLQDGLLEARTHFGPSVIQMTLPKMRYLYDLRVAIETLAVRYLTASRNEVDFKPLRALIEDMRHAARKGDVMAVVEAELRFHETMCELGGNPYVSRVGRMIDGQLRMALAVDNANYEDLADVAAEHEPVLAAIESGDAIRATAILTTHILSSLEALENNHKARAS